MNRAGSRLRLCARAILGSGVNHLFRMESSAGVRISEPVYRQLPNDKRGPWAKEKPPATYSFCD